MRRAIPLSLLLALVLALPKPSAAQYMYLDANGDGIHTEADVVAPTGTMDVDVWVVTDQNRGGSSAVCSTRDGSLTINSYVVGLRAVGGTIDWGTPVNRMSEFSIPVGLLQDSTDFFYAMAGATIRPPGRYRLATLHPSVRSGAPRIDFTPVSPLGFDPTSFGSACSGLDYDNTQKLGSDWFDADGLGSGVPEAPGPTLAPIPDLAVDENSVAETNLVGTDPDGDSLRLNVRGPGFAAVTNLTPLPGRVEATVRFAPTFSDAGIHRVRVDVSDGVRESGQTFYVTVRNVNRPPVLPALPDVSVEVGTTLDVPIPASDPDGGLMMRLIDVPSFCSPITNHTIRLRPGLGDEGVFPVTVEASDGIEQRRESFTITVTNSGQHQPPVFEPIEDVWMDEGDNSLRHVEARDPEGGPVTLRLLQAPAYVWWSRYYGEVQGSSGILGISPGPDDSGTATVRIEASTSLYSATTEFTIHVRNRAFPPTISASLQEVCIEPGERSIISFGVSAPDLDSLVLTSGPLPSWVNFTDEAFEGVEGRWGSLAMSPGPEETPSLIPVEIYANRGTPDEAHWTFTINLVGYDECPTYGMPFTTEATAAADAGGPYSGMAGVPMELRGVSNPVLNGESFRWTFGDGHAAVGSNTSHTYHEGGTYQAVLRVSRWSSDSATVAIADAYPARAVLYRNHQLVNLSRKDGFCLSFQRADDGYDLNDLDPASMSLWVSRGSHPDSIPARVETDPEQVSDGTDAQGRRLCFAQSDLRRLFAGVRGRLMVEARVQGRLRNGARVRAPIALAVVGNAVRPGRVEVRPNPMNPSGIIAFETSRAGHVRVRIYDVSGRLVRTVWDGIQPEGIVELPMDGTNGRGTTLGSGVYYYRVETVDGVRKGRLTVLK